jgi:hypothetical protein
LGAEGRLLCVGVNSNLITRLLTKCWLKTDQVKLYGPNGVGYTRATSIFSLVSEFAKINKYLKPGLGSDCFLKLRNMSRDEVSVGASHEGSWKTTRSMGWECKAGDRRSGPVPTASQWKVLWDSFVNPLNKG